jgi:hypothetical protein
VAALWGTLASWPVEAQVRPELLGGPQPTTVPPPETGLVAALGGYRIVPQGDFVARLGAQRFDLVSRPAGLPTVLVPLSYRVDREWVAEFALGYGADQFRFSDGSQLGLGTASLTLGGQRLFDVGVPWLEPYVGFGVGYWISSITGDRVESGSQREGAATGGFVSAGLRAALTPELGLVLEDRLAYAELALPGLGIAQVGGNSATAGLYYVWRQ